MSEERTIDPVVARALELDAKGIPAPPAPAPEIERPQRRLEGRQRDDKGRVIAEPKPPEAEAAAEPEAPQRQADKGPTRGRPVDASEEDGYVDDGLERRPLDEGEGNSFEIPVHLTRRGWVYEWKTSTVMGQPVDPAETGFSLRQGWRPCTDPHIRGHFMPPSWDKTTIEQRGQMLYTRPERLQREAGKEAAKRADEQKLSKLRAALAAPEDQSRFMPRSTQALSIDGELGAYADDPIGRNRR